eukprot:TRINITY_DN6307_c3_g1_i1.p1 TRINITY_DN6307_c3_g1~~TRINITY_DN6307_c3_g1_i1.p1  ORF type:complete len:282 (+),score=69.10 TRINITY_DN6307_c3_g1_i1:197-1042(+)
MDATQDFYKLLGVQADATSKEIGKAFRQKARLVHPDKLPPESSEAQKQQAKVQFQLVAKAYEVLSDPAQRAGYDIDRTHAANFREPSRAAQRPRQQQQQQQQASGGTHRPGPDPHKSRHEQEEDERIWKEMQRAREEEEKKRRREERAREAKEQNARKRREQGEAGLGAHWVGSSGARAQRSESHGEFTGAAADWVRGDDAQSDASSELSFDIGIDLSGIKLNNLESAGDSPPEWDDYGECWEMKRPGSDTKDAESPLPPAAESKQKSMGAVSSPKCCVVQ